MDGVRRIDQRLLATEGGRRAYGLFGTFAAGAVRSDGRAAFREHVVDRMLVTGGAWTPGEPVTVLVGGAEVRFRAVSDPGPSPTTRCSVSSARCSAPRPTWRSASRVRREIVLADGRWRSQQVTASPVVGVVERWSRGYLEPQHDALIAALGPGDAAVRARRARRHVRALRLVRPPGRRQRRMARPRGGRGLETRAGIGLQGPSRSPTV